MAKTLNRCLSCYGLGFSSCTFGGMTPKGFSTRVNTRAYRIGPWQSGRLLASGLSHDTTFVQARAEPMWVNLRTLDMRDPHLDTASTAA